VPTGPETKNNCAGEGRQQTAVRIVTFVTKTCKNMALCFARSFVVRLPATVELLNVFALNTTAESFTEVCRHIPILVKLEQHQWPLTWRPYMRFCACQMLTGRNAFRTQVLENTETYFMSTALLPLGLVVDPYERTCQVCYAVRTIPSVFVLNCLSRYIIPCRNLVSMHVGHSTTRRFNSADNDPLCIGYDLKPFPSTSHPKNLRS
jgi:hypothetical protein